MSPSALLSLLFIISVSSFHFTIIIFGWKREKSLKRLLTSIMDHRIVYDAHQVDLSINLDGGYSKGVLDLVNNINWTHGTKIIRKRKIHVGLKENVMNSWNPINEDPNSMAIFLEDDIEVSPYYFEFVTKLLQKIDNETRKKMFGISLNTPKFNEISIETWGPWNPCRDSSLTTQDLLFNFQLPSSWGAVYFASQWLEFVKYYHKRKYCHIGFELLPKSGSPYWKESWKRYLIEWMVMKPSVMIYPNLPYQTSYSIHHREKGIHSAFNGASKQEYSLKEESLNDEEFELYGVPLLMDYNIHLAMMNYINNLPNQLKIISHIHKEVPSYQWLENNAKRLQNIYEKSC